MYIFIDPEKSYEDNCEHSVKINEVFKKMDMEEDKPISR